MTDVRNVVELGAVLELTVEGVAHGGHCVARHDGQVVFVRHTLPGETVRAVVTSRTTRFLRADAIDILVAAPGRVPAPCPESGPGLCGGCDWQHADLATQRVLKGIVVAEQLARLAGIQRDVVVEELPGAPDGLGWRTRERFSVAPGSGRLGLHRHRSSEIHPLDHCPLAHPGVTETGALARIWSGRRSVQIAVSDSTGDVAVLVDGVPEGARRVREHAVGREWRVAADGFWQVHPAAAQMLVSAVLDGLKPRVGEHAIDLYSGVGLYVAALAEAVGAGGRVDAVESSRMAVRDARRNLRDLAQARLHEGDVTGWLAAGQVKHCDLVVLDPPRAGAGSTVVTGITRLDPRAVVYVACDPASLARDVKTFADLGWGLGSLRAFDLFPMTQHVECVAVFEPVAGAAAE